jgi:hypothetical protein
LSIASEIKRILQAKLDLKTSFQRRGIPIEDDTLDTYANKLDIAAGAVQGTFIPDKDTRAFEIKGLYFEPTAISISNNELYDKPIADAIISYSQQKEYCGSVVYGDLTGSSATANPVAAHSFAISWEKDGFLIEIPYSVGLVFKAGYVYNWIISGG